MEFIADNMLGKLAKWLRFMGYDVLYPKILGDNELIQLSQTEDRILLTRDKELSKRKGLNVLYVHSDQLELQLKQVIEKFDLKLGTSAFFRCPECNYLLHEIDKALVVDKVPKGVFEHQEEFWVCENCKQYYWQGTHYDKIKTRLEGLFK